MPGFGQALQHKVGLFVFCRCCPSCTIAQSTACMPCQIVESSKLALRQHHASCCSSSSCNVVLTVCAVCCAGLTPEVDAAGCVLADAGMDADQELLAAQITAATSVSGIDTDVEIRSARCCWS
jgi:hypothetical protein